jgi:hypothetical protein
MTILNIGYNLSDIIELTKQSVELLEGIVSLLVIVPKTDLQPERDI